MKYFRTRQEKNCVSRLSVFTSYKDLFATCLKTSLSCFHGRGCSFLAWLCFDFKATQQTALTNREHRNPHNNRLAVLSTASDVTGSHITTLSIVYMIHLETLLRHPTTYIVAGETFRAPALQKPDCVEDDMCINISRSLERVNELRNTAFDSRQTFVLCQISLQAINASIPIEKLKRGIYTAML